MVLEARRWLWLRGGAHDSLHGRLPQISRQPCRQAGQVGISPSFNRGWIIPGLLCSSPCTSYAESHIDRTEQKETCEAGSGGRAVRAAGWPVGSAARARWLAPPEWMLNNLNACFLVCVAPVLKRGKIPKIFPVRPETASQSGMSPRPRCTYTPTYV